MTRLLPLLACALLVPLVATGGPDETIRASVELVGEPVQLLLRPGDWLADGAPVRLASGQTVQQDCTVYDGDVAGLAGFDARMRVHDGQAAGVLLGPSGNGWLLTGSSDRDGLPHHLEAVPWAALPWPDGPLDEEVGHGDDVTVQESGDAPRVLRLAYEADHGYYQENQDDWACDLQGYTASVEAIYQQQFDIRFELVWLGAWDTPDPYTSDALCRKDPDQPDGRDQLAQLRSYWNSNHDEVERDLVHLAIDEADGSTVGCAYINGLATPNGYGVSQMEMHNDGAGDAVNETWFEPQKVVLMAHEMGHNFGGLHERSLGAYGVSCQNLAAFAFHPSTIMNPMVNPFATKFSDTDAPGCWSLGQTTSVAEDDAFPEPRIDGLPESRYDMNNVAAMAALSQSRLDASS